MDIQYMDNPSNNKDIISIMTRGVMTDAKIAKLNQNTKRPALVAKWEKERPNANLVDTSDRQLNRDTKDYSRLLEAVAISPIDYEKQVNSSGAKKLRVNKIVNKKASDFYNSFGFYGVMPKENEVVNLINQINVVEAPVETKIEAPLNKEVNVKHEQSGDETVNYVKEAIRNEFSQSAPVVSSRTERNAQEYESIAKEESSKQELKAGDMDLYNKIIHGGKEEKNDIFRQLQGATEELAHQKDEYRKIAEKYEEDARVLEKLKADVENKQREKAQEAQKEYTAKMNEIKAVKEETLAITNDWSNLKDQIKKYKEQLEELQATADNNMYSDYSESRSFGRHAA